MFNNKERMKGLSAVVLKRCSSLSQVGTSMENQKQTTEQIVTACNIKVVHVENLLGVSGSVPGNRTDIDSIIARKSTKNDFQLLLIQDASRFTRAGQGHGQKLIYDLRAEGILVYFVAEDVLVDSDMAEMYVSFLFSAARHAVKMLAYNAAVGSMASFLADRSPYTKRPPFGLDRMYSNNGVDIHIIRNLPDGTQEQLNPQSMDVIRRFAKNEKSGVPQHYIKQKSETIRLVPGDPKAIAVIYLIFRLHLVDGLGMHRVAGHLNDHGVPSPQGKEWHTGSVRDVILSPIYIGEGIRCRTKTGVHYVMGEGAPQPSNVTVEMLKKNKRIKPQMRPKEEWHTRPQPHLADYLPAEFRELAKARIAGHLASIADAKPKRPNRDRHHQSSFILKDKLVSKQGGYKMTGRVGGKGGTIRTYGVSRGASAPKTKNMLARRIPAEPVEAVVMEMLRQVLLNRPGLEDAIKQVIASERGKCREAQENPDGLRKELKRKRKQLIALSDVISAEEDEALDRKIASLKAEMRVLEQRIQDAEGTQPQPQALMDVGELAKIMAGELETFGRDILGQDVPHIKRVIDLLVYRMEADLETRQVEVEFAIPTWLGEVLARHGGVGLDELSVYRPFNEAHTENRVILGSFRCDKEGRPTCYTCTRMKLAG